MKQISDNEIYLLIKYIKSILWRVAKRLSYIEDARCLKVKVAGSVDITSQDFHIRVQIGKANAATDMDRKWRHSKWKKVRAEVKARTKR